MESSIIYSRYVTGKNNIGRKEEASILANLLRQGENVAIYEPPKTGKTSLIQQTFFNMKTAREQFVPAEMSLGNTRTTADLLMRMGSTVLKGFASTPSEYGSLVETFLSDTHFVFDEQIFSSRNQILSLNWDINDNDIKAIFSLPYRIASSTGQKIFVLLDEFQNIMLTEDGEKLCRMLEGIIQEYNASSERYVSFIFCGSQVNAMKFIFEQKRFFHRCVERLKIKPIDEKEISDSIIRQFLSTGKVIDKEIMVGVCKLFKGNIWYINHFCNICDGIAKGFVTEPMLKEALEDIISIHEPRFKSIMSDLTTFQISLLKAVIDGYTKFSSSEVINRYSLNSSANVRRLKDALCKKEILTFGENDEPEILDPLFEYWVRKFYFEIKVG